MKYRLLLPTLLVSGLTSEAALVDVTTPGTAVRGFGGNSPAAEQPFRATDGNPGTKYLNQTGVNSGLIINPITSVGHVVTEIRFTTANDDDRRDPASYVLQGTLDGGVTWVPIATGGLMLPTTRGATTSVSFANTIAYHSYRLSFPTLRDSVTQSLMQIADTLLYADDATLTYNVMNTGGTVIGFNANGPGADWPANESPGNVADLTGTTKYLNFGITGNGANSGIGGPVGFDMTPNLGPTIVNTLSLVSANDTPGRDPRHLNLYGSNNGIDFSLISMFDIPDFVDRHVAQVFEFANATAYATYRFEFDAIRDPATVNSFQLAEASLYGIAVPEPAAASLLLGSLLFLAAARRRRA